MIRVEHELHGRRRSRNVGLLWVLLAFVGLVFALTVVKVRQLSDIRAFESYDHVANPSSAAEAQRQEATP